jgi:hypothetical protein
MIEARDLARRLRDAAATAANDDYSKSMTLMRFRHTERVEAMLAAADWIDEHSTERVQPTQPE